MTTRRSRSASRPTQARQLPRALEQEFFDTADGFSKWCNAAGGINGRKIVIDKLDAKLFNVGQVMTQACLNDFLLVGNGNAFDSAGVKIRERLQARRDPGVRGVPAGRRRQVPGAGRAGAAGLHQQRRAAAARRRLPRHQDGGVGVGGSNLASLIPTGMKAQEYLKDIGIKVPVYQAQPPLVDNYRPYMEQMKSAGARGIYIVSAQDPSPIVQAMKNVGWTPDLDSLQRPVLRTAGRRGAKATPDFPPSYVQFNAIPFELANKYPVRAEGQGHREERGAQPEADLLHALVVQRVVAVGQVGHSLRATT